MNGAKHRVVHARMRQRPQIRLIILIFVGRLQSVSTKQKAVIVNLIIVLDEVEE
jgi:hypothetical protein